MARLYITRNCRNLFIYLFIYLFIVWKDFTLHEIVGIYLFVYLFNVFWKLNNLSATSMSFDTSYF